MHVSVGALLRDSVEDELFLNRKLPRTIRYLLLHPGLLTDEYVRGRVVRYTPPLRLYLVSSVVMFLVLSFVGLRAIEGVSITDASLSLNADSARATLQERIQALEAGDTAGAPERERAMIRQMLIGVEGALAAIPDSATVLDSATARTLGTQVWSGGDAVAPGVMQPWAQNITLNASTGWLERAMQHKVEQIGHLPPREAFQALVRDLLVYAPHMVFLLLPLFAFLLKLLYIRRDRFYAEHFVFALHVHAFVFAMATLMLVLPWGWLRLLLMGWIAVYMWLAMKRVYEQGWIRTTLKAWALGAMYFFVFLFGLVGLTIATLLLT